MTREERIAQLEQENAELRAQLGLSQYLRFYNEKRLHQSLDYRTPKEVYCGKEGEMPSNGKVSICPQS